MRMPSCARGSRSHDGKRNYAIVQFLLQTGLQLDEVEKSKIIYPDIAKSPKFAFDNDGIYSINTTYFIPIDMSLQYLVSLLNASLVDFFFRTISASIRGSYLRFFDQYVKQIPIRRIYFI